MKNLFKVAVVMAIVLMCISCSSVGDIANFVPKKALSSSNDINSYPDKDDNTYARTIELNNASADAIYVSLKKSMESLTIIPNYSYVGNNISKSQNFAKFEFSNMDLGKGFENCHYSILVTVEAKDNECNIYAKVSDVYSIVKGKEIKVPALISNKIPIDTIMQTFYKAIKAAIEALKNDAVTPKQV